MKPPDAQHEHKTSHTLTCENELKDVTCFHLQQVEFKCTVPPVRMLAQQQQQQPWGSERGGAYHFHTFTMSSREPVTMVSVLSASLRPHAAVQIASSCAGDTNTHDEAKLTQLIRLTTKGKGRYLYSNPQTQRLFRALYKQEPHLNK